jgi:septal ring factor EnvC (AmiA/AmiB activator)
MDYFKEILQILELVIMAGGFLIAIVKMGKSSREQRDAMIKSSAEVQAALNRQNEIITELKIETKDSMTTIGSVLTALAVYDTRVERIERDIQDLRHGIGFAIDITSARSAVKLPTTTR